MEEFKLNEAVQWGLQVVGIRFGGLKYRWVTNLRENRYKSECFSPTVRGSGGTVMLLGFFCWHDFDPLEGRVTINQ